MGDLLKLKDKLLEKIRNTDDENLKLELYQKITKILELEEPRLIKEAKQKLEEK